MQQEVQLEYINQDLQLGTVIGGKSTYLIQPIELIVTVNKATLLGQCP